MSNNTQDQGITKDTSSTRIRLRLCLWCVVLCGFLVTLFVMAALTAALIEVYNAQHFSVPEKIMKPAPNVTTEESILEEHSDEELIKNMLKKIASSRRKEEPSSEDPYLRITIFEKKTENGVRFSVLDVENLYGSFRGHVPPRYTGNEFYGDYLLTAYDEEDAIIEQYCISSSRFTIWDNFSTDADLWGGIKEKPFGILTITIPYETNIHRLGIQDWLSREESGKRIKPPEIDLYPVVRENN